MRVMEGDAKEQGGISAADKLDEITLAVSINMHAIPKSPVQRAPLSMFGLVWFC